MPGGSDRGLAAGQADLPGDRRQGGPQRRHPLLRVGRAPRCRPLRQNGPQRHRVRRHAVDLRGLLDAQARPRPVQRELYDVFAEWNQGELDSYLIEITRDIFSVKRRRDRRAPGRRDPRYRRRQGDRQMDEPVGPRSGRAEHAGDRGRLRPVALGDEGRPGAGEQGARRSRRAKYHGDRDEVRRAGPPGPLRLEDLQLRPGLRADAGRGRASTSGRWTSARSPCCGAAAASSARCSSSGSRRRSTPIPIWRTCSWPPISPRRIEQGAARLAERRRHGGQAGHSHARPSPPRWPTTTATAPSGCPPTCCRPSATTSAPIPTSESTSQDGVLPHRLAAGPQGAAVKANKLQSQMTSKAYFSEK